MVNDRTSTIRTNARTLLLYLFLSRRLSKICKFMRILRKLCCQVIKSYQLSEGYSLKDFKANLVQLKAVRIPQFADIRSSDNTNLPCKIRFFFISAVTANDAKRSEHLRKSEKKRISLVILELITQNASFFEDNFLKYCIDLFVIRLAGAFVSECPV